MPLRVGLSLYLSPTFSRRVVEPCRKAVMSVFTNTKLWYVRVVSCDQLYANNIVQDMNAVMDYLRCGCDWVDN